MYVCLQNTLITSHDEPVQKPYHQSIHGKIIYTVIHFVAAIRFRSDYPRAGNHSILQRNVPIYRKQMGPRFSRVAFSEFPHPTYTHPSIQISENGPELDAIPQHSTPHYLCGDGVCEIIPHYLRLIPLPIVNPFLYLWGFIHCLFRAYARIMLR